MRPHRRRGVYLTIPVAGLLLTPLVVRRPGWRDEARRCRRSILGVAVLMTGSYLLVLQALRLTPVSYVAPARELGIIFAVVLGVLVLGEHHGAPRLAGAALILLGVGLIATAPPREVPTSPVPDFVTPRCAHPVLTRGWHRCSRFAA